MGRGKRHKKQAHANGATSTVHQAKPKKNIPAEEGVVLANGLFVPGASEGFRWVRGPFGTLVLPKDSKWHWQPHEKPFRSLLFNDDREIVSMGWPKFGNWGENSNEADTSIMAKAFRQPGQTWLTEKIDGSLLIRFVVDGNVVFRTRGIHAGGRHGQVAKDIVQAKYPQLMDPTLLPDQSLLFEVVSPELRVLVNYDEPGITFLGSTDHATAKAAGKAETEQLGHYLGVPMVQTIEPPDDGKVQQMVEAWTDSEGVVARTIDGQTMVKIKTPWYASLHRLSRSFSVDETVQMVEKHNVKQVQGWRDLLQQQGEDWEVLASTQPVVEAYLQAKEQADAVWHQLDDQVDLACALHGGTEGARQKLQEDLPQWQQTAALLLLDGRHKDAEKVLYRTAVDNALAPLRDADEPLDETVEVQTVAKADA